jgi:hypothetical protein
MFANSARSLQLFDEKIERFCFNKNNIFENFLKYICSLMNREENTCAHKCHRIFNKHKIKTENRSQYSKILVVVFNLSRF